jgi:hypothetical protein
MLDVHPSHGRINNVREFLLHILVVAIGLLLALALEQAVSALHHRYQVRETRQALRQERAENRTTVTEQTRAWRWWVVEMQNNLLVLRYLQQHPGTPQQQLPGVLVWNARGLSFDTAVWDAAHQSGVISLLPQDEIEASSALYSMQSFVSEQATAAALATVQAGSYQLLDPDPTHLSAEQVTDEIRMVQVALMRLSLLGRQLLNLVQDFPDFPPTVTLAEWEHLNNMPDAATRELLAPARALTHERLKAAGYPSRPGSPR